VNGDGERDERPKRSWAEIDRLRDNPRIRRDPRSGRDPADTPAARDAARQYLKKLDHQLFAKGRPGRADAEQLAARVRESLGTPALADACRAYLDALGAPQDAALVAAFLDARERDLQLAALRGACEALAAGSLVLGPGLRAQLRTFAAGLDDELAEAAERALASG
jgi:hypothetical protein